MYCSKCGSKNDETSKFCVSCGNELETSSIVNSDINNGNSESLPQTNLSIASLVCLILSFVAAPIGYFLSIKYLYEVPWLLISLILAIISRIKYKDKMSKVLVIIDVVLIAVAAFLAIAYLILVIFLISKLIDSVNDGTLARCIDIG